MPRNNTTIVATTLFCKCCGNKQQIFRKKSKQKQCGHIKHLWCYRCHKVTPHTEFPYWTELNTKLNHGKDGEYVQN